MQLVRGVGSHALDHFCKQLVGRAEKDCQMVRNRIVESLQERVLSQLR